jgi:hypothetical protein
LEEKRTFVFHRAKHFTITPSNRNTPARGPTIPRWRVPRFWLLCRMAEGCGPTTAPRSVLVELRAGRETTNPPHARTPSLTTITTSVTHEGNLARGPPRGAAALIWTAEAGAGLGRPAALRRGMPDARPLPADAMPRTGLVASVIKWLGRLFRSELLLRRHVKSANSGLSVAAGPSEGAPWRSN